MNLQITPVKKLKSARKIAVCDLKSNLKCFMFYLPPFSSKVTHRAAAVRKPLTVDVMVTIGQSSGLRSVLYNVQNEYQCCLK